MYERMLDKNIKPDIKQMACYCGENTELFLNINNWLEKNLETSQNICFPYGNNYGWGISHKKKQKLICNIFPEKSSFTVMIRLSDMQFGNVYKSLQGYTKDFIDNRYPCGNGGWIHYRVTSKEHLIDIKKILSEKCSKA